MTDTKSKNDKSLTKTHKYLIVAGVVAVIVLSLLANLIISMNHSNRSAANFCKTAKEEKPIISGNESYEKTLESYKKLEKVAPESILADITTIKKGYEAIVENPEDTINAGIGMQSAEKRAGNFITENCKDF